MSRSSSTAVGEAQPGTPLIFPMSNKVLFFSAALMLFPMCRPAEVAQVLSRTWHVPNEASSSSAQLLLTHIVQTNQPYWHNTSTLGILDLADTL